MENIIKAGPNTILAHLKHLKDHGEEKLYKQAVAILEEKGIPVPSLDIESPCSTAGCPGLASQDIDRTPSQESEVVNLQSELRQWPIQLHLLSPIAPYFENADLLISADCAPYAYANFHQKFLKGKILITLCPKLDSGIDKYIDKLAAMFETKNIKSVTIIRMEVPCCGGIEQIVQKALEQAGKNIQVKVNIVSIQGDLLES